MELLKRLTQAWGVSGREKAVREMILQEVLPYADQVRQDAMGNLIVLKKGNGKGKRIMLSAHTDEVGLQVTKIESDGRLRVCKVGWVWAASLYNDKVIFQNGTIGVVGCCGPVEEAKNDVGKLYIDIGATSREEAEKYVKIGDYCGFIGPFYQLAGGRLCSKSFDDRAGCWLLIEALKRNDGSRENDVYYAFTVQEEVGCRGAVTAAQAISPDIGISIDVTPDHAYPSDLEGANAVGAGVGVKLGDPSAMLDEDLVEKMLRCCEENHIPYQRDVMDRGGTDSSSINRSGCGIRVCGISLVDRYAHSQSSVISWDDLQAALELIDKYTALHFEFPDPVLFERKPQ